MAFPLTFLTIRNLREGQDVVKVPPEPHRSLQSIGFAMTSAANEIFYVDDSPDDLLLINYQMRGGSYDIVLKTFGTGIAVMMDMERRIARAEPLPALVVADFYMPIIDGPELFRLIRANSQFDAVLLASCSGGDDPNDRQSAKDAGAKFFFDKPLDLALCQEILAGNTAP